MPKQIKRQIKQPRFNTEHSNAIIDGIDTDRTEFSIRNRYVNISVYDRMDTTLTIIPVRMDETLDYISARLFLQVVVRELIHETFKIYFVRHVLLVKIFFYSSGVQRVRPRSV